MNVWPHPGTYTRHYYDPLAREWREYHTIEELGRAVRRLIASGVQPDSIKVEHRVEHIS